MTRIIALAGSLRTQSYNKQLVQIAARAAAGKGASVQLVELADYDIPLFSEDLEAEGVPAGVIALKQLLAQSQGLLLASPEYNGSISGVLKNALDWLSRPSEGFEMNAAFKGKAAGIMAASPGGYGGARGLKHVREVLTNLGMELHPDQVTVPAAYEAFDDQRELVDLTLAQAVQALSAQLVEMAESATAGERVAA
ncbi:MAG: NAD(P)H-dependent oxidoreductase [Gammaproteobacteria bacterium]|nr:NAD(P)H-dependent oxidoreductase [Gammaproteobacteria bacterium]